MKETKDIHFLVVDDMKTMRMIVKQVLKGHGATILSEADDGDTAWKILDGEPGPNGKVDFVVSDWNMPIMTGLELLKKCRSDERYKNVAFLMVTAEQEGDQVKDAIVSGVDGYVVKPFNPESFGQRLSAVMKKRFS